MKHMAKKDNYDLFILGGGMSGLSLALQIKKRLPDLEISVIEKNIFPVTEGAHKVGEATVELSTYYLSEIIGLKAHLESKQLPKLGLRYFFSVSESSRRSLEDRLEFGTKKFPPTPSFQLDRGILENHLKELCDDAGVDVLDNSKVKSVILGKDENLHAVEYMRKDNQVAISITCKWLVDASSRASILKRELGLQADSGHQASSAWFRIAEKISVNDWHDSDQWHKHHGEENSRWYSTNHFMGEGYWIWFIPLASGSTSIGIVADNNFHSLNEYNSLDKALIWLEKHEPICAAHIFPHLAKVQDFRAVKNFSHSSQQVFSADRWFMTGEAGVFLDPFYSPGSDYIAMSNTLITNIIEKDAKGEDVAALTRKSNRLYLGLFNSTCNLYQDKYQLFGKPTVMILKYLWDTTLYWGLNSLLFIQNKFNDQAKLQAYYISVSDLADLNTTIQQLFIDWAQFPQEACVKGYVDISCGKFDFFIDMNRVLTRKLSEEEFQYQLEMNAEKLRTLYCDVVDYVVGKQPELTGKYYKPDSGLYGISSPVEYVMKLITGTIPMDDQYTKHEIPIENIEMQPRFFSSVALAQANPVS
jgi:flavin-dependent dehydrogenase